MKPIKIRRTFAVTPNEAIKLNIDDEDSVKTYYLRTLHQQMIRENNYDYDWMVDALDPYKRGENISSFDFADGVKKLPAEARRKYLKLELNTIKFSMLDDKMLYYEIDMTFDLPGFYAHYVKPVTRIEYEFQIFDKEDNN